MCESDDFKDNYFKHIGKIIKKLNYENVYFLFNNLSENYLRADEGGYHSYGLFLTKGYLNCLCDCNVITNEEYHDMMTAIKTKDYRINLLNTLEIYLNYKKIELNFASKKLL